MNSSRTRAFRPPPPAASKRYNSFAARRRNSLEGKRLLLKWLRRPSTFVLTAFLLLFAPPLWFLSRTTAPAPGFLDELDERRPRHLRTSPGQESGKTEVSPPVHSDSSHQPHVDPKPKGADVLKPKAGAGTVPPPPPVAPKQQPTQAPNVKEKEPEGQQQQQLSLIHI